MKKFSFIILYLIAVFNSPCNAQVIFSEDFDGIPGSTAGGAGTYAFPTGWLLRNVDNRTPDTQVAFINDAWERREDFGGNVADSVAFSTSYYSTPTGPADDWMWTPPVAIPSDASAVNLSWNARAYDAAYRDGYEVRIMVAPNEPTGGTGSIGNQVTHSDVLFSTPAEVSSWVNQKVSLASYAGQTVRIGFRNNSNDKFILVIDDVLVEKAYNYDAALLEPTRTTYTQTPVSQVSPLYFSGRIQNMGALTLDGVYINTKVFNGGGQEVFSSNSLPVTLASQNTSPMLTVADGFSTAVPGKYKIRIQTVIPGQTDQIPGNDMALDSMLITPTTFARDDNTQTKTLGIGAGQIGYLGTTFPIRQAGELASMSVYLTSTVNTGNTMKMGATVWKVQNGKPQSVLFDAPHRTFGDSQTDGAKWHEFRITPPLNLLPGDTVLVSAKEIDSTLAVGTTPHIFLNSTNFVIWPASGGWKTLESFGSQFRNQLMIRADFACVNDPNTTALPAANTVFTGYQTSTSGIRHYITDHCSTILASISGDNTPTSLTGITTIRHWIETTQPSNYVRRHYQISPETNASTASGVVTLYFTQQDFDSFNGENADKLPTGPGDGPGITRLLIEKVSGESIDGTGYPATYPGPNETIDPEDDQVVWNAAANRWEVTFHVTGFSGFFVKTQLTPLPLYLVKFEGKREGTNNQLNWETAAESKVSHFEIERSRDAKRFASIHRVSAKNGVRQNYVYTDPDVKNGRSYYRLKMKDFDGTYAYSRIVILGERKSDDTGIHPNPVRDFLNIELSDQSLLGTIARVIDIQGVMRHQFEVDNLSLVVSAKNLSPGHYLIKLENGETLRFVKE